MTPIQFLHNQIDSKNLWEEKEVLNRNEYLSVKGKINTSLYYVESGSLRIFVADESEDLTIRFGYQENFIAALDSYITEKPSNLYIQAIKKTTLKVISKETFTEMIESDSKTLRVWQKLLEMLVYQQMEREHDILTASPV